MDERCANLDAFEPMPGPERGQAGTAAEEHTSHLWLVPQVVESDARDSKPDDRFALLDSEKEGNQ